MPSKAWIAAHKEELKVYHNDWYMKHKESQIQEVSLAAAIARLKAYAILGGCCVRCGECDPTVLEFNHKNGDGGNHRRELGSKGKGRNFVTWILSNPGEAAERLELLCANCHTREHSLFNKTEGYQEGATS